MSKFTIKSLPIHEADAASFGKAYHDFVKRCYTGQKPNYSEKAINFMLDCAHIANGTPGNGLTQQGFKLTKANNVDMIGDCLHLCYENDDRSKSVDVWLNPHSHTAMLDLYGFNPERPHSSTHKEFTSDKHTADDFYEFIKSLPNYKGESKMKTAESRKLTIRVHEAKELPVGAVYIKDLPEGKSFTLKPYGDEPPESALWTNEGYWDEYGTYSAHRWINVNHSREFTPNTIVYPI